MSTGGKIAWRCCGPVETLCPCRTQRNGLILLARYPLQYKWNQMTDVAKNSLSAPHTPSLLKHQFNCKSLVIILSEFPPNRSCYFTTIWRCECFCSLRLVELRGESIDRFGTKGAFQRREGNGEQRGGKEVGSRGPKKASLGSNTAELSGGPVVRGWEVRSSGPCRGKTIQATINPASSRVPSSKAPRRDKTNGCCCGRSQGRIFSLRERS